MLSQKVVIRIRRAARQTRLRIKESLKAMTNNLEMITRKEVIIQTHDLWYSNILTVNKILRIHHPRPHISY